METRIIEFPAADAGAGAESAMPKQACARQTAPPDAARDGRDTQTGIPKYGTQAQRRARGAAAKSNAPRHARPARMALRPAVPPAAVHAALPAPRSLRGARPAARRRKRRRQRLLLAGAALAVALLFVLRAALFAPEAQQPPGEDDAEAYVPAAAIPREGPPYTVAIDAGHGGSDTGAQGVVEESAITEATVGYLESWLLQDENYTPVRTHAYDTFLENTERAATANQARAALLLSVHGNSDPYSEQSYGFECYPQPPGRTHHEASLCFAHLIAGKFGAEGQRLRGNAGVRYIYYVGDDARGYQKEVIEESDNTVRAEQTFGLLEKTNCPAVLAEQCFVTSPDDVDGWGDEDGCRRAARLYYEAICAYFGTEPLAAS